MNRYSVLIKEEEDPALEELYGAIRQFHNALLSRGQLREIISGLFYRHEISRLLLRFGLISYRNLILDWDQNAMSYRIFDRAVTLASLHLQVLHSLRQRKKTLKATIDSTDIRFMLQARDAAVCASKVEQTELDPEECEYVSRKFQGYLQSPVELSIDTIEKIFLLIDEAEVEYYRRDT